MTERTKLRFEDVSYTDSDLIGICRAEAKFNNGEYQWYSLDRKNQCIKCCFKVSDGCRITMIPFNKLKFFRVGKDSSNVMLTYNGKKYTRTDLIKKGNKAVGLYGGYMTDFEIDKKNKRVLYCGYEHGEPCSVFIEFDELDEDF